MHCWSCGQRLERVGVPCPACNAPPALPFREGRGHSLSTCPGCGYRGDGMPYFRRAGHAALLVAATVFTYGVGGLAYWLIKRHDRICPSCGLSWGHARIAGRLPSDQDDETPGAPVRERGPEPFATNGEPPLPGPGLGRRVTGVLLALLALGLLGGGIVEGELALVITSGAFGVAGAGSFAWGWRSLQRRREALLQRLQRRVLHLAQARGGRLTATDVASALDVSLNAAERVLLSMDDGFRVRSDVTEEGLLVFDFLEIRLRSGRDGGKTLPEATP